MDMACRSAYIFLALWRSELSEMTLRLSSPTSTMLGSPSPGHQHEDNTRYHSDTHSQCWTLAGTTSSPGAGC